MTPAQKAEYLAAATDADNALTALAAARARGQTVMDQVASTAARHEVTAQGTTYGMVYFDKACLQAAGAVGLLRLFEGGPETAVRQGVRAGGTVFGIMTQRTSAY